VTITVTATNQAPVANNATFQVQQNGSVRIDFSTLASDADGDALTLTLANPAHGTLTRNTDGSYTYTPAAGYTGSDVFTYTVSDGRLSATATVTLTVTAVQDDDHCGGHHHHHGHGHHHHGHGHGHGHGHDEDHHHGRRHGDHDGHHHQHGSIVVKSHGQGDRPHEDHGDKVRYIVVNHGSSAGGSKKQAESPRVNWSGNSAPGTAVGKSGWHGDFLDDDRDQRSLAEKTGLVVRSKERLH
jgi:hypothetical protein